jgi:hypothetical protein
MRISYNSNQENCGFLLRHNDAERRWNKIPVPDQGEMYDET